MNTVTINYKFNLNSTNNKIGNYRKSQKNTPIQPKTI